MFIGQPKQRQIALKQKQRYSLYSLIKECHQEYKWSIEWMCKQAHVAPVQPTTNGLIISQVSVKSEIKRFLNALKK